MEEKEHLVNMDLPQATCNGESTGLKTIQLNDQKAGMEGLDSKHINQIIYNASKGTSFFQYQQKRQQKIDKKVGEMMDILKSTTENQRTEARKKMDGWGAKLNGERDLSRTIVHFDMDAFYAAVEMRDNPDLREKPMAVGSLSMLSTSNYHARKFGVRAAMPGFIGKKLCQDLIIVPCDFKKYTAISKQIREIFKEYDPDYLPMGLDEAYLDLTDYVQELRQKLHKRHCDSDCDSLSDVSEISDDSDISSQPFCKRTCNSCVNKINLTLNFSDGDNLVCSVVQEIRKRIFDATQLTASAGIAPNRMLAKVCSDKNKPNGQFRIQNNIDSVNEFVASLPIRKVSGIGPVQGQLLNALGIHTCRDMWNRREILPLLFTPTSVHFYVRVALGIGDTEVKSDYVRKSTGVEETFKEISDPDELHEKCQELCEEVAEDLRSRGTMAKVVVLKIKTVKFDIHTRNSTLPFHTSDIAVISREAKKLLDSEIAACHPEPLRLRLMGVRVCNLLGEEAGCKVERHQVTLKDFIQSKSCVSGSTEANTEVPRQSFVCPICLKSQENLLALNKHLDQCVGAETESDNSHLSADNSCNCKPQVDNDGNDLFPVTENTRKVLPEEERINEENVPVELRALPKNNSVAEDKLADSGTYEIKTAGVHTALSSDGQDHFNITCESLICPVCDKKQEDTCLINFNKHVDTCLSRGVIKELSSKYSQSGCSEKRKQHHEMKTSKRAKVQKQANRRIEDFFLSNQTIKKSND